MDKHDEKAREILDDPQNFIRDEIAGYIPMHFNAFYGVLADALRQSASEAAEKATAAERKRCAEVARHFFDLRHVRGDAYDHGVAIATAIEKEPG